MQQQLYPLGLRAKTVPTRRSRFSEALALPQGPLPGTWAPAPTLRSGRLSSPAASEPLRTTRASHPEQRPRLLASTRQALPPKPRASARPSHREASRPPPGRMEQLTMVDTGRWRKAEVGHRRPGWQGCWSTAAKHAGQGHASMIHPGARQAYHMAQ